MHVLETTQRWDLGENPYKFLFTIILLQDDAGNYLICRSSERTPQLDFAYIMKLEPHVIPNNHLWPLYTQGLTICAHFDNSDNYIKQPRLTAYDETSSLADLILQEAYICESLQQDRHSHLVEYFGCLVEDGLIKGLCFRRYAETLEERMGRGGAIETEQVLEQIRAAAHQLRIRGLQHNDIKPSNIMFRNQDDHDAVLVDFDSCSHIDAPLPAKRGLPDVEALADLAIILSRGSSPERNQESTESY